MLNETCYFFSLKSSRREKIQKNEESELLHKVEEGEKNQKPSFLGPKYPCGKLNGTIFHGKQETGLRKNQPGRAMSKTRHLWRRREGLTGKRCGAGCPHRRKAVGSKAKALNIHILLIKCAFL